VRSSVAVTLHSSKTLALNTVQHFLHRVIVSQQGIKEDTHHEIGHANSKSAEGTTAVQAELAKKIWSKILGA